MALAVLQSRVERMRLRTCRRYEQEWESADVCRSDLRWLSIKKPRLRAEVAGSRTVSGWMTSNGFLILISCCGSPMGSNSVLEELSDSELDDIHDETLQETD